MRAHLQPFVILLTVAAAGLWPLETALGSEARPQQAPVHKTTQSESYVMVEPIYASIFESSRPRGLLLVEFGLDVPDAELREQINRVLPALRDAYVRSLLTYAATAVRPWRQPSVEDIANRLQGVTDFVMRKKGARVLMAQTAIRLTR